MSNGECNIGIVSSVIKELSELEYDGIVAVKSTVPPGTVLNLSKSHKNLNICFVPEFLKERLAGVCMGVASAPWVRFEWSQIF